MQVKCALCDKIDHLKEESFQAKRLRNRRLNLYICPQCYKRIEEKTTQRHATGKFHLFNEKKHNDDFI